MTKTETNTEKAIAIFEEKAVTPALRSRIMEMDPGFAGRTREEQEEVVTFLLDQAEKTIEGVKSRLPMISIRHAGANAVELPKRAGQDSGEIVREFEGVILDQYLTKAYWEGSYSEGNGGPPDCASLDGLTPYVKEPISENCTTCPFNKFGSGVDRDGNPTRGKRCRDQKRTIIWLEGHELPCRMTFSVKNIGPFDTYMNDLRDQGRPIGTVRTKFKAVKAASKAGQEYTSVELSTVKMLDIDEVLWLKRNVITPFADDFRIGAIEADEGAGESGPSKEDLERGTGKKAASVM